jgi:hypothetical protein
MKAGTGYGVKRKAQRPLKSGIHRNRPGICQGVSGVDDLYAYFRAIAARLRGTRVYCGEWARVCSDSMIRDTPTAIFLDPPYAISERDDGLYSTDAAGISDAVREWAIAHGERTDLRIALCGYEGEHDMPSSWDVIRWESNGMGNQSRKREKQTRGIDNAARERIWFSPGCLRPSRGLFDCTEESAVHSGT